jgi:tetratricopeptide (TPR) repeat protein
MCICVAKLTIAIVVICGAAYLYRRRINPLIGSSLLRRASIGVALLAWMYVAWRGCYNWKGKGILAELLALFFCVLYAITFPKLRKSNPKQPSKVQGDLFFVSVIVFLVAFPFSVFAHAIGLAPGLFFILAFSYFIAGLTNRERSIHNALAMVLLGIFVWLWGEAGLPGLVVMPVDLPEGREDMNFTADGVANALETELKDFGSHETAYGGTEAARIFAKDFPSSPWFKGTEARPPLLEGLTASHVIVGTDVEGFPLSNIYHILRHVRGAPLLEAQILLGSDNSLTLALRRSNAPLECRDKSVAEKILREKDLRTLGEEQIDSLWQNTSEERDSWTDIPDARGCKKNPLRWILDYLDVTSPPSTSEERLANVTIHNLSGDERLTAAIHLAAIQAMDRISPERLAVYYDTTGKLASSRDYYKKALPYLLAEAHDAPAAINEYPRQRLASALIRIGDFETCDKSDSAYHLASALFPDDLHVQARIGYGYLVRAEQFRWSAKYKELAMAEHCGRPDDQIPKALDEAMAHLRRALINADPDVREQDLSPCPSPEAALNPRTRNVTLSRLGLSRWRETIAWTSTNFAHALVLKQLNVEMQKQESPLEARDSLKQNSLQAVKEAWQEDYEASRTARVAKITNDPVLLAELAVEANQRDVRAAVTLEFVEAENHGVIAGSHCSTWERLKKLDSTTGSNNTNNVDDRYDRSIATLHNTVLMEDQFQALYEKLSQCKGCGDEAKYYQQSAKQHQREFVYLLTLDNLQGRIQPPADLLRTFKEAIQLTGAQPPEPTKELFLQSVSSIPTKEQADKNRNLCKSEDPHAKSLCARLQLASECTNAVHQVREAAKAANNVPDDYFIRRNLGLVQWKTGDIRGALVSFQESVLLNPNDPSLRYLLGAALNANNRPQEARNQLEYGRLLDPSGWKTGKYFNIDLKICRQANPFIPEVVNAGGAANEKPSRKHPGHNRASAH